MTKRKKREAENVLLRKQAPEIEKLIRYELDATGLERTALVRMALIEWLRQREAARNGKAA